MSGVDQCLELLHLTVHHTVCLCDPIFGLTVPILLSLLVCFLPKLVVDFYIQGNLGNTLFDTVIVKLCHTLLYSSINICIG